MLNADPFASSIQCPLDQVTGCFFTANNAPATLTAEYSLLPGVLHAYFAAANDLPGLIVPVVAPGTVLLFGLGLFGLCFNRVRVRD